MASTKVALILGYGPRIGAAVARKFAGDGYQVVVVSRSGSSSKSAEGYLSLKADFTKPETIPPVFERIKSEFHASPSVVVYNAAARTTPAKGESIFAVSEQSITSDLTINTIAPYVAAQQAVQAWSTMPENTKKAFIFTGNGLNASVPPLPMVVSIGMGKNASSFWIALADKTHKAEGYRFYYADERFLNGQPKAMEIDGDAHADFYAQLAQHQAEVPWLATFVKGQGYVEFK